MRILAIFLSLAVLIVIAYFLVIEKSNLNVDVNQIISSSALPEKQYKSETNIATSSVAPAQTIEISDSPNDVFNLPEELYSLSGAAQAQMAKNIEVIGRKQNLLLHSHIEKLILDENFSQDDLNASLEALLKLTVNMNKLNWFQAGKGDPSIYAWNLFTDELIENNPRIDEAITNLARRSAANPGCEFKDMQLDNDKSVVHFPHVFWYEYSMAKLLSTERRSCNEMPYEWLLTEYIHGNEIPRLEKLKKYIGNEEYASIHLELRALVSECDEPVFKEPLQYLGVCIWRDHLDARSRKYEDIDKLPKNGANDFKYKPIDKRKEVSSKAEIDALMVGDPIKQSSNKVESILDQIRKYGPPILEGYWINKDKSKLIYKLRVYSTFSESENGWYVKPKISDVEYVKSNPYGSYLFFLISTKDKSLYVVSNVSAGQYDEGDVARISDMDSDGNIEVWFSGQWGECDGDNAMPGVNCNFTKYIMFEQFGNRLANYINGSRPGKIE